LIFSLILPRLLAIASIGLVGSTEHYDRSLVCGLHLHRLRSIGNIIAVICVQEIRAAHINNMQVEYHPLGTS
jgi:hypothetical protein